MFTFKRIPARRGCREIFTPTHHSLFLTRRSSRIEQNGYA